MHTWISCFRLPALLLCTLHCHLCNSRTRLPRLLHRNGVLQKVWQSFSPAWCICAFSPAGLVVRHRQVAGAAPGTAGHQRCAGGARCALLFPPPSASSPPTGSPPARTRLPPPSMQRCCASVSQGAAEQILSGLGCGRCGFFQNPLLEATFLELKGQFKEVQFRKAGSRSRCCSTSQAPQHAAQPGKPPVLSFLRSPPTPVPPPQRHVDRCPWPSSRAQRFPQPRAPLPQIGVDLGTPGAYLKAVEEGTKDIDVALLFNNAGYIVTGFFDKQCGPCTHCGNHV